MKTNNPNTDYLNLISLNALAYTTKFKDFENDLGQRITFYEDPIDGDDSCVWVAFPDHQVAFLSAFYDISDMTLKVGDYFSPEDCRKNGWSFGDDMDYVPRLVDGELKLKYETE